MRKMLLTLFTVLMISLLSTLSTPAHAGPPTDADGLWQYQPFILGVEEAGCNTFLTTFENGKWTGTFKGTSTEDGKVVIHCSGSWSFNAIVSFSEVTVDGKEGTLEMSVVGRRPDENTDWQGKWVILSGTDDLATLRGQGTWWGPGAPDVGQWGDIYYSGQMHFEPN
jgi:hypothetical protein